MKFTLPIILVVVTAVLIGLALLGPEQTRNVVGIAAGSAVYTRKSYHSRAGAQKSSLRRAAA